MQMLEATLKLQKDSECASIFATKFYPSGCRTYIAIEGPWMVIGLGLRESLYWGNEWVWMLIQKIVVLIFGYILYYA